MIKKILFYGNEMKYFIGLCEYIKADSIGNPGKRTFKIVARSNSNNVTIWMEKESLFQIGISLAQFIATNTEPKNKDNFEDKNLVINNDIEFRSDDISLSHDSRTDIFTIFSSGSMVYQSLEAAKILDSKKISCKVVNMHTIKPIDKKAIDEACNTSLIVSIEEHNIIGGLGSAISEYKSSINKSPKQLFLGVKDTYGKGGSYKFLQEKHRLTPKKIVEDILLNIK